MPYSVDRVSRDLEPATMTVSTRGILAYAAGISVSNAQNFDDDREDGIRAVPFYCVTPEWLVVQANRLSPNNGLSPDEVRRAVHAKQDSIFHRPIRPGDQLRVEARLVEAREVRTGTLQILELATTDANTGEPVATTWSTGMYRGTPLEGEPLGLDAVPALPVNPSAEFPKTCTETQVYIPREMPHVYSECADIWNPVHTERVEALAAGLPDIILHGTATWALAGKEIVNTYADGDGNALQRLTGRFVGMVIPGSTITIRHAPDPDEPTAIRYEVLTEDGNLAMDQGVALIDP